MKFEYVVRKQRIGINGKEPAIMMGKHMYSGTGENLSHLVNSIDAIRDMSWYDEVWGKDMAQANQVIKQLEKEAKRGWYFELYCIQKIKKFGAEHEYALFFMYIEVFFNRQSVALISIDCKERLEKKILKIKKKYSVFDENNNLNNFNLEVPTLFTEQAAGILSHELLGHMFEIDNFFTYQYKNILPFIEKLQIDIMDLPDMKGGAGFYLYDDMGIKYKDVTICSKGKITGDLIGGNYNKMEVSHALRRDDYSKPCIPRMSNLYVSSEKKEFIMPDLYIEITKLGKCYVNHKKGIIIIDVEQGFICQNGKFTGKFWQKTFHMSIIDLLRKIKAVGEQNDVYPLQCQKQGQVIECGVQTMDWLIEEGMKNVILF